jgi:hypothetical protein
MALVAIRELTDQKGGLRSLHPLFIVYRQAQKLFNSRTRPLCCMRLLIEVERGINMQRGNSIRILFMSKPIRKPFKKDESLSSPMYTFNAFNIQPNKEKVYMCCTQHRAPARMFRFTGRRLALDGGCCLEGFSFFPFDIRACTRSVCCVSLRIDSFAMVM